MVKKATMEINTRQGAEEFRKAADEFTASATKSKKAARDTLVKLGIHTKTGRLTKNYK
jgi:hypothetical protein